MSHGAGVANERPANAVAGVSSGRWMIMGKLVLAPPHPNLLPQGEGTDVARLWCCE